MGGFMWIAVTLSNSNKDKIVEYIELRKILVKKYPKDRRFIL